MNRMCVLAALLAAALSAHAEQKPQTPEEMRREIEADYQRLKNEAEEKKAAQARRAKEEARAAAPKNNAEAPGTVQPFSTDAMAIYATSLGRGIACGANADAPMRRVGRWIDAAFPAAGSEKVSYVRILAEGIRQHAMMQKNGQSPDSCATVLREFQRMPWP